MTDFTKVPKGSDEATYYEVACSSASRYLQIVADGEKASPHQT